MDNNQVGLVNAKEKLYKLKSMNEELNDMLTSLKKVMSDCVLIDGNIVDEDKYVETIKNEELLKKNIDNAIYTINDSM